MTRGAGDQQQVGAGWPDVRFAKTKRRLTGVGRLDSNHLRRDYGGQASAPLPKASWGGLGECPFSNDLQRLKFVGPILAQCCGDALLLVAVNGESTSPFLRGASPWDNGQMPNATITVDAALKERLVDIAGKTGQSVDEFVEALLRRIASTDVDFDRGVPVFPPRPGAPTLTVEDVDRLADGQ
jgi:hypothetical protein